MVEYVKDSSKNAIEAVSALVDTGLALISFPPLATIINTVAKTVTSLREEAFIENLESFLKKAEKATPEQREKFINGMAQDYNRFSRTLIIAIDIVNDKTKSEMLGTLFLNLLREQINTKDFMRLSHVVQTVYVEDLLSLKNHYDANKKKGGFEAIHPEEPGWMIENPQSLISSNLLIERAQPIKYDSKVEYDIEATVLGLMFNKYAFGD